MSMRIHGSGLRAVYPSLVERGRRPAHTRFGSRPGDPYGLFDIHQASRLTLRVLVGDGMGWDHISVSTIERIPTWKEMCLIKELFFEDECCVIQYHPPKSKYINIHNYVLHMWHKQGVEYELPPEIIV